MNSFQSFIDLFNYFISIIDGDDGKGPLEIPKIWIWDIINSFIGQFQLFQSWKATNPADRMLTENTQVWSVRSVLCYLHYLVKRGNLPLLFNELDDDSDEVSPFARRSPSTR